MFRFTIRDVLWLMVVVGMACLLAGSASALRLVQLKCSSLEGRVRDIEENGQQLRIESEMFRQELEKATGRSIYGFGIGPDPNDSQKLKYEIQSNPVEAPSLDTFGIGSLFRADFEK